MKTLHDYVLVTLEKEEVPTSSLIDIDEGSDNPYIGVVYSAGPGKILESGNLKGTCVKPHDRVLIGRHNGVNVRLNNQVYIVLKETDIVAIL